MMKVASSGKKDAIALLDLLHGHGAAMDAVDDVGFFGIYLTKLCFSYHIFDPDADYLNPIVER